mgnify:FL=1
MAFVIPAALVPSLRAALAQQGFPAQTLDERGNLDPIGLLAVAYDTFEFRSNFTPPQRVKIDAAVGPSGDFSKLFRPAMIASGKAGRFEFAPHGVPSASAGWLGFTVVVGALVGIGYLLGRASK